MHPGPAQMSSQNGTHPAPRPAGGAFAARSQPTQFLPDLPATSWRAAFYIADRARIGGIAVLRLGYILLIGTAVTWLLARLPGGWAVALLWLAAALTLASAARFARRNHYVNFMAKTTLPPSGAILPPTDKVPVYVTGNLGVEQKQRAFTMLPGFYRTFATREHALLCRANERRLWGIAAWPEEETGLWYAFFTAGQIVDIAAGSLTHGGQMFDTLAISYRPALPSGKRRRREPEIATLYLSFPEAAGLATVFADLAVDWSPAMQRTETP